MNELDVEDEELLILLYLFEYFLNFVIYKTEDG